MIGGAVGDVDMDVATENRVKKFSRRCGVRRGVWVFVSQLKRTSRIMKSFVAGTGTVAVDH
jgi:hypothetical protein